MKQIASVLDLRLENRSGHFVPDALAIGRALNFAGAKNRTVTDTKCRMSPDTKHWLRILPPPAEHNSKTYGWCFQLIISSREIRRLTLFISQQLYILSRDSDHVVVHLDWISTPQLIAIALGITLFKIANFFRYSDAGSIQCMLWLHAHAPGDITPTAHAVIKFLEAFRVTTRISVYTKPLSAIYSARFPGRVFEIPNPLNETINRKIIEQNLGSLRRPCESQKVVCLLAGQVFPDKHYEILEAHVRDNNVPHAGVKIVLQAPQELGLKSNGDLEISNMPTGHLQEEEYVDRYLGSDVVLMPYSTAKYAYTVSGVFVDAVSLGCMPIVPLKTVMARELETFGLSQLAINWDNFSWDLVASMARNIVIKNRLNQMSLAYRERHCLPSVAAALARIIHYGESAANGVCA